MINLYHLGTGDLDAAYVIKLIWRGKKIAHVKFIVYSLYYHRQTSSYCLYRSHHLCCISHILSEAYLVGLCSLQIFPENALLDNNSLLLLLCSQLNVQMDCKIWLDIAEIIKEEFRKLRASIVTVK